MEEAHSRWQLIRLHLFSVAFYKAKNGLKSKLPSGVAHIAMSSSLHCCYLRGVLYFSWVSSAHEYGTALIPQEPSKCACFVKSDPWVIEQMHRLLCPRVGEEATPSCSISLSIHFRKMWGPVRGCESGPYVMIEGLQEKLGGDGC